MCFGYIPHVPTGLIPLTLTPRSWTGPIRPAHQSIDVRGYISKRPACSEALREDFGESLEALPFWIRWPLDKLGGAFRHGMPDGTVEQCDIIVRPTYGSMSFAMASTGLSRSSGDGLPLPITRM